MDEACGVNDSSRGAQRTALSMSNILMNCIASTTEHTMEGIHSRRGKEVLVRDLHISRKNYTRSNTIV